MLLPKRLAQAIIVLVSVVWTANFSLQFVPALDWHPDASINGIFMAVVGGALALSRKDKGDGGKGDGGKGDTGERPEPPAPPEPPEPPYGLGDPREAWRAAGGRLPPASPPRRAPPPGRGGARLAPRRRPPYDSRGGGRR